MNDQRGPFAHEVRALAGQLAQLALRARRDEARPHQPVAQQLRQPFGVAHVGLAAGDGLDVLGVEQPDREAALQQVEDRVGCGNDVRRWRQGYAASR